MRRIRTMIRLPLALVGMGLLVPMADSGEAVATPCVHALEQVTTLKTWVPVYKLVGDGQQQYIDDAARPAKIARLQKVIDANYSASPQTRQSEESEAQRLHTVRSPECAIERDKLSFTEKPGSRDPPDTIAAQLKLVTEKCSLAAPANLWLLQMVWPRH